MRRLDIASLADAIADASSAQDAWSRFAGALAERGLGRVALHEDLDLSAPNPFADSSHRRQFGVTWSARHDRRLRHFRGNVRDAPGPESWPISAPR
ncbi:hypothetical protein ACXN5S_11355 [Pseudoroseicyclus sp. H15]